MPTYFFLFLKPLSNYLINKITFNKKIARILHMVLHYLAFEERFQAEHFFKSSKTYFHLQNYTFVWMFCNGGWGAGGVGVKYRTFLSREIFIGR